MKRLIVIITIPLLFSCASIEDIRIDSVYNDENDTIKDVGEERPEITQFYNVIFTISHHTPYCGGTAPTPEIMADQTQLMRNTSYILVNQHTQEKETVHTDDKGRLRLELQVGYYAIREMYKNVTLDEFKKQYYRDSDDYYQEITDEDCYKNWWKANLTEFEIFSHDTMITNALRTSDRCFTGNNPCLRYNGPYPP